MYFTFLLFIVGWILLTFTPVFYAVGVVTIFLSVVGIFIISVAKLINYVAGRLKTIWCNCTYNVVDGARTRS